MARPTRILIDEHALLHNVQCVKQHAPNKKIIAMVKANAYGCGLALVLPVLETQVDAFGVASLEEALILRKLGSLRDCILFQGIFSADELPRVVAHNLQCVIHQACQLDWLLQTPLSTNIKIWVKVDTGMHRLGFDPKEVPAVMQALQSCPWVDENIGLMTHLACADEPTRSSNHDQLQTFNELPDFGVNITCSMANSAAIIAMPEMHADVVRPGLMLYGVSPFLEQTGHDLGLLPVMRFVSAISAIHHYPPHSPVGYGGRWQSDKSSIIGIVAAGYGDGYPRQLAPNTQVWVNGFTAPVVGRVSMDMLTVDLTNCPGVSIGDVVELWGQNIPIETVAKSAGMIPYELLCHVSARVR